MSRKSRVFGTARLRVSRCGAGGIVCTSGFGDAQGPFKQPGDNRSNDEAAYACGGGNASAGLRIGHGADLTEDLNQKPDSDQEHGGNERNAGEPANRKHGGNPSSTEERVPDAYFTSECCRCGKGTASRPPTATLFVRIVRPFRNRDGNGKIVSWCVNLDGCLSAADGGYQAILAHRGDIRIG